VTVTPEVIRAFDVETVDRAGLLAVDARTRPPADLSEAVRGLSTGRVRALVRLAGTGPEELRLALLSLWSRVEDDVKRQLGEAMLAELDAAAVHDFFQSVVDAGATIELAAVLRGM
jgi:hypothetical protein